MCTTLIKRIVFIKANKMRSSNTCIETRHGTLDFPCHLRDHIGFDMNAMIDNVQSLLHSRRKKNKNIIFSFNYLKPY